MPVSVFDMQSLQHLWGTDELRAIFSEDNRVQKWLDFEAALAAAQAELGIVPVAAAKEIAAKATIATIDIPKMSAEIRRIKHSLVPALKQLQAACSKEHGEWLHYGATTQDVVDTGVALQLKEFHAVAMRDLRAVGRELARLASFEPVSENPVFSFDFAEAPRGPLAIVGSDNNGNRIKLQVP